MISTTSQLVALVESNNQPSAIRYEPNWRYVTPALISLCKKSHPAVYMSDDTARALMMFSYGKYQIMGSVLYEIGYKSTLLEFQNSTMLQDAWFKEFVHKRDIDFSLDQLRASIADRERFGQRYNGDAKGYAAKLVRVMKLEGVM